MAVCDLWSSLVATAHPRSCFLHALQARICLPPCRPFRYLASCEYRDHDTRCIVNPTKRCLMRNSRPNSKAYGPTNLPRPCLTGLRSGPESGLSSGSSSGSGPSCGSGPVHHRRVHSRVQCRSRWEKMAQRWPAAHRAGRAGRGCTVHGASGQPGGAGGGGGANCCPATLSGWREAAGRCGQLLSTKGELRKGNTKNI